MKWQNANDIPYYESMMFVEGQASNSSNMFQHIAP